MEGPAYFFGSWLASDGVGRASCRVVETADPVRRMCRNNRPIAHEGCVASVRPVLRRRKGIWSSVAAAPLTARHGFGKCWVSTAEKDVAICGQPQGTESDVLTAFELMRSPHSFPVGSCPAPVDWRAAWTIAHTKERQVDCRQTGASDAGKAVVWKGFINPDCAMRTSLHATRSRRACRPAVGGRTIWPGRNARDRRNESDE